MCVVSMVYDHFKDKFPPTIDPIPMPYIQPLSPQITQTITYQPDLTELKQLIKEFREAIAAAKKVDKLTGQPDCEDPAKAKLEERVVALEKEIKALKKRGK